VRAIVGGVEHDGVVDNAQLVEQLEKLADMHVVLDHTVGILVLAGDAAQLRLDVGAKVHASTVPMRFLVSGPVSSIFWVPSGMAQE